MFQKPQKSFLISTQKGKNKKQTRALNTVEINLAVIYIPNTNDIFQKKKKKKKKKISSMKFLLRCAFFCILRVQPKTASKDTTLVGVRGQEGAHFENVDYMMSF